MEWTGSIRWIHNPVQSRRIWIGLVQKFTNSADFGLNWIQKCTMCIPYQWRRIAGGRTPTQMPPRLPVKIPVVKKGKMTFLTKREKMTPLTPGTLDWGHLHRHSAPAIRRHCPIFRDLRQFLRIVTLPFEVLPSNIELCTSLFVFTCPFYKVFGRYLLCCVRLGHGQDWIQILDHQLDWTGLGSVARGFGLDWIVSIQSIPYSASHVWLACIQVKQ